MLAYKYQITYSVCAQINKQPTFDPFLRPIAFQSGAGRSMGPVVDFITLTFDLSTSIAPITF